MKGDCLYLNCPSGVSGDMIVAALLHLGADLPKMQAAADSFGLGPIKISYREIDRQGLAAGSFEVDIPPEAPSLKNLKAVGVIVEQANLPPGIKQKCLAVFHRLAEAEGRAHGTAPEKVHFHELGSPDTLVDVICALLGLDQLRVEKVYASAVNVGSGSVRTEHGIFPVPAPATINLLTGFDVYSDGEKKEKTTPTGAVILAVLAEPAAAMPPMTVLRSGFGAGKAEFKKSVNLLQAILGRRPGDMDVDSSVLIECNIDDMNPQVYPYLMNRLLAEGAQDVFASSIFMKKGRPGFRLGVLCPPDRAQALGRILMAESTTIGLRMWPVGRLKAPRKMARLDTEWGEVKIKISYIGDRPRAVPEFEDCRRVAEKTGRPLPEVMAELSRMAAEAFEGEDAGKETETD